MARSGRNPLILYVGSDAPDASDVARWLRRAGHVVLGAVTPEQGLLLARCRPVDLLIAEVGPSASTGLELARQLRADPATAGLPLLHLAATAADQDALAAGLESGADAYLWRPVTARLLLAQVESLLRVRPARDPVAEAQREIEQEAQESLVALEELQEANAELESSREELLHQQKALQESEARYRALFESMREGFFLAEVICDASGRPVDGRFLDANPAAQALTGLPREEAIGRTAREVLPGLEEGWIEALGRVALTGEPAHVEGFLAPLGRYYAVTAHSPRPGWVAAVFTDVTELVEAQQERERQRDALVAAERARAELAESLNRELAHRTKNHLTMVAGLLQVQMLQQRDFGAASALSEAMSRVMTFASLHQELQSGTPGSVALLPVLQRIAAASEEVTLLRGVTVTVSGDALSLPGRAAMNLAVIANELITNATKHGAPGPDGRLRVQLRTREADGRLWLSVWNSGNPVPADFDLDRPRGLGLRLVRDLAVGQYGGALTLVPEEGGTRADVAVPLAALREA